MIDPQRLRNIIGSCDVEDVRGFTDNVAIALCTYFSAHMDRPEPDPEYDESGWGVWVMEKTEAALSLLTAAVLKEITRAAVQPSVSRLEQDAALGRIALRFVDRAGDYCEEDPAERICDEFYKAMADEVEKYTPPEWRRATNPPMLTQKADT